MKKNEENVKSSFQILASEYVPRGAVVLLNNLKDKISFKKGGIVPNQIVYDEFSIPVNEESSSGELCIDGKPFLKVSNIKTTFKTVFQEEMEKMNE